MSYSLSAIGETEQARKQASPLATFASLRPFLKGEGGNVAVAFAAILANSLLNLAGPILVGRAIDTGVIPGDYGAVFGYAGILVLVYALALGAGYVQTAVMGGVGQRLLFTLRNSVFQKLQDLPVAFFNQNKAGDLISRINNDTDKLNQFFSQSLMQFIGNAFIILGAAVFLLVINWRLGLAALAPAAGIFFFTRALSPWVKRANARSLQTTGGLSAEIQESLDNFKVIVAFNRRDYFRGRFSEANEINYRASVRAGIANNVFLPVYGLAATAGQFAVLAYGVWLTAGGQFTVGLLISYLAYVTRFYDPLRHMAMIWATFQTAMAGWDRIAVILGLTSDMARVTQEASGAPAPLLEFRDVRFAYPSGMEVLHGVNLTLERGKTYALVGPTGGGKTTSASLMARLFDPTAGKVLLDGRDIRSYDDAVRARRIGFILQEPFLFTGTVRDNILYGNDDYAAISNADLAALMEKEGLGTLLSRFESGLDTKVSSSAEGMSLGQKQLIAFMRAVLRHPDLLILDEATANIDTVTEKLLEDILRKLPATTTKVVIAHRLNTIENADEIYFVNAGEVIRAGSLDHAVEMLLQGKRDS